MVLIILLFKWTFFFPVEAWLWEINWKQIWSYIIAHLRGKWATVSLFSQLENWEHIKVLQSQVRWGDHWWRTNWISINNLLLRLGLFLNHFCKYKLLGSVWGYPVSYTMVSGIVDIKVSIPIAFTIEITNSLQSLLYLYIYLLINTCVFWPK